jgi:hypothetical protein
MVNNPCNNIWRSTTEYVEVGLSRRITRPTQNLRDLQKALEEDGPSLKEINERYREMMGWTSEYEKQNEEELRARRAAGGSYFPPLENK